MPDIDLIYPLHSDFEGRSSWTHPELFNYVCLSGKQLFLHKSRGYFVISTRGWSVPKRLYPDYNSYKELNPFYKKQIIWKTKKLSDALFVYHNIARCLLTLVSVDDGLLEF